jgi:hypothetical protein
VLKHGAGDYKNVGVDVNKAPSSIETVIGELVIGAGTHDGEPRRRDFCGGCLTFPLAPEAATLGANVRAIEAVVTGVRAIVVNEASEAKVLSKVALKQIELKAH